MGNDVESDPWIMDPKNMKIREIRKALELVEKHQTYMLNKWEEIHG